MKVTVLRWMVASRKTLSIYAGSHNRSMCNCSRCATMTLKLGTHVHGPWTRVVCTEL